MDFDHALLCPNAIFDYLFKDSLLQTWWGEWWTKAGATAKRWRHENLKFTNYKFLWNWVEQTRKHNVPKSRVGDGNDENENDKAYPRGGWGLRYWWRQWGRWWGWWGWWWWWWWWWFWWYWLWTMSVTRKWATVPPPQGGPDPQQSRDYLTRPIAWTAKEIVYRN